MDQFLANKHMFLLGQLIQRLGIWRTHNSLWKWNELLEENKLLIPMGFDLTKLKN